MSNQQIALRLALEAFSVIAIADNLELDKVIAAFKMAEQREVKDVVIDNMGDPFIVKAYVTPQPAQQEPVGPEPFGYFQYDIRLDAWVQNRVNGKGAAFYTAGDIQALKHHVHALEGVLTSYKKIVADQDLMLERQTARIVDCHATGVCVQSGLRAEQPAPVQHQPCKGTNCGITNTHQQHAVECIAEHDAVLRIIK